MGRDPVEGTERGRRTGGRSALAHLLLAAIVFAAVAAALRPLVPWPARHQVAARIAALEQADPPYDLVFVGSSTVRRAFVPVVFESELAARGIALRALNFGVPGASTYEVAHLLETILADPGRRPRYVLFEPGFDPVARLVRDQNAETDRTVAWHTPAQTLDVWTALAGARLEPRLRWQQAARHAKHALWNATSFGQADRSAAHWLGLSRADEDRQRVVRTGGFEPLRDEPGARIPGMRREFLADTGDWEDQVRRVDRRNHAPPKRRRLQLQKLVAVARSIRSAGATPIAVLTPTLTFNAEIHAAVRSGVLHPLLAFDSPERFPHLYERAARYDRLHLNEQGAELFSRELARAFARQLETQQTR